MDNFSQILTLKLSEVESEAIETLGFAWLHS